ncbi:TlpA family protein disulfide reductase [Natronogracilivirga saccharolytica]|nr:TlpA disulfide reductase family protein [Natronogracilivirga saccharolytica]
MIKKSLIWTVLLIIAGMTDALANPAAGDTLSWRPAEVFPATREHKAPDFELKDPEGKVVKLSDFDGKIVLLNIWATWCPPCRDEVPALIRLQEAFEDDGVQIVGVAIDENGAAAAVSDFAASFEINYPVPLDDGSVQDAYGPLSAIPTTYILDRQRNVRFYAAGYLEYDQMENAVKELLEN